MKLSNDLQADDYQLKGLADGTDLQDAVTMAQLGNLGPLAALQVIELRLIAQLLAELPERLDREPGNTPPIDLTRMRMRIARST